MLTQWTHATRQRLWCDVDRPFLALPTTPCSRLDSSPDCSVARVVLEWSMVSRLSVTPLSHDHDAPAHCLAEKFTSRWSSNYKVKVAQWKLYVLGAYYQIDKTINFCGQITFVSRAKGPLIINHMYNATLYKNEIRTYVVKFFHQNNREFNCKQVYLSY